jgi:hypothetical protein
MKKHLMFATVVLMLVIVPVVFSANIWQDDFSGAMKANYKPSVGGNGKNPPKWVQEGGVVKQIEPKPGDPTYLAVELSKDIEFCGQLIRIRFDLWEDHDRSRAGVGFWLDTNDKYSGYTTVIHNSLVTGNYQFLNDGRAWDNDHKINFNIGKIGVWFWMRTEIDSKAKTVNSKCWLGDLKDEPKDWMLKTDYSKYGVVRSLTRWVGLNGGAGTDGGASTVSFDDWYVYDSAGAVTTAVDLHGKLTTTWGDLKR